MTGIIRGMVKGIMGAVLALLIATGGFQTESEPPIAGEDEFVIAVWLETMDEVCELSFEYMLDGEVLGGGGVCCADGRTPLGDLVCERFGQENFPEGADLDGFSIVFCLSGQFSDGTTPSADAAPVEGEIFISAEYGENYSVVISGDRENGYRATVSE